MKLYIYEAVYDYLHKKKITFSNLLQIATDGASAVIGKHNEFIAKLRKFASHIGQPAIHCIIHLQHLAAKALNNDMEKALQVAILVVNFVKANALHDILLQQLC